MNIDFSAIRKILFIQYKPFGDVLLTTGVLPYIKKRFPEAQLHFLVARPYHKVLEGNPNIDDKILFSDGKGLAYLLNRLNLIRQIRSQKYDLVIDQMRGTGSGQLTYLSGAPYRLGFTNSAFAKAYNIKVVPGKNRYSAEMKFDLLKPLGIEPAEYKLEYFVKDESQNYVSSWFDQQKFSAEPVCFSPGTPSKKKQWDLRNYARLGDLLQENGIPVVLLWAPDEIHDVREVAEIMKQQPVIAPPTDFNQAAAFLGKCRLLVCNDGGINHLSAAVGTPSLAIFGNTNPENWSPDIKGHYFLFNPDFDSANDNSFGISPEDAFRKISEIREC